MKSNVIAAALVGLVFGIAGQLLFNFGERISVLACLFAPLAFLFGLGLPILIGFLAAAWGARRGLMATPNGIADGALAAGLVELVSRLVGICAGAFVAARSTFLGSRFLIPSVGPAAGALFSGVWSLGWLVVSVAMAALLGALGGLLYNAKTRR